MLKHCFSSHCGSQERWKVKKFTQTVYVIKMKDMNNRIEIKHIDDNQVSNVFVVFFWIIDNKIDWKQCTSRGHIILYLLTIIIMVWFINKNKVTRLSSITVYKQSDKYTCKFCMLLQQPSLVWRGLGFLNFEKWVMRRKHWCYFCSLCKLYLTGTICANISSHCHVVMCQVSAQVLSADCRLFWILHCSIFFTFRQLCLNWQKKTVLALLE